MEPPLAEWRDAVARLERQGLADARVAAALRAVPRHLFVPPEARAHAWREEPLGIGEGQTISAPHMVAIMATALDLRPGHRVLEVGGGSGYHAAVSAELVRPGGRVWSVERIPRLAERARDSLREAGYDDTVEVVEADGSAGLPDRAPFDRIFVAAAAPAIPPPLVRQLADGGRLLCPVGDLDGQELVRYEKTNPPVRRDLGGVRFVPLLGAWGFPHEGSKGEG